MVPGLEWGKGPLFFIYHPERIISLFRGAQRYDISGG